MTSVPGPHSDEIEWLIFEQAGVLTTGQAKRLLKPGIVRGHLKQRRWRRICRGVLFAENGQLKRDQQLWVAVLAAGPGASLAGVAAAAEGGVQGLRAEPIDVLVPAKRNRSVMLAELPPDMARVRVHRTAVLPEHHQQVRRPPRTTVARAVIDGAAWAGSDYEARDLIARAHQQGRATVEELRAMLDLFPRIRRHQLIDTVIADLAGGATALSEIDLVALCRKHRIAVPDLQLRRTDEAGRNRFVDAHWAGARLLVEIDGSHHMLVENWAADMLRQNQIWISGDRILRFPASLVRSQPAVVAAQIRAALLAARDRSAAVTTESPASPQT
jgi:very-short-patch-repair endonuclease